MKKLIPVLALGFSIALASCHAGSERHTETLSVSGNVVLDNAKTKIIHMAPNSFVSYEKDGDKIAVSTFNKGVMTYEVDGEEVSKLTDEDDIKLLNMAIKALAKQQESKKAEGAK